MRSKCTCHSWYIARPNLEHLYIIKTNNLGLANKENTRREVTVFLNGCRGVPNTFPTHKQTPGLISGSRPFLLQMCKLDKIYQTQVPNHTLKLPMVGGDSKFVLTRTHVHKFPHTHTTRISKWKRDRDHAQHSPNGGRYLGKIKI